MSEDNRITIRLKPSNVKLLGKIKETFSEKNESKIFRISFMNYWQTRLKKPVRHVKKHKGGSKELKKPKIRHL